jgi:hypothetical protein
MIWRVHRGDGHPTWSAVWFDLGRLRLIRCAPDRPSVSGYRGEHPNIPGSNTWMICWRRRLPEFDPATQGQWKTSAARKAILNSKLTEADRREFGIERADEDEPDKVRLLEAFAPTECFWCEHATAPAARREIVGIIRAIRHREPLPQGDLPVNCCRRMKEDGLAASQAQMEQSV